MPQRALRPGSPHRLPRAGTALVVAVTAILTLVLAACGSSPPATTTSTTTSGPPATLPPSAVSKADIQTAYMTLFDLANPAVTPKLLVVQDGPALRAAFTAAIHSALAKQAGGAKVLSVTVEQGTSCTNQVLPTPCASVTYDILSPSGSVVLSNSKGAAVYLSSHWLVAKSTICTLLTLDNGGKTPSGC